MALSSIRIFAGTLVPIAMCIRFIKMVVSENPPGGAWGATVAHRLKGGRLYSIHGFNTLVYRTIRQHGMM